MDSIARLQCPQRPLHLSFNPIRPSFSKPQLSLPFRNYPLKFSPIKASSFSPKSKPSFLKTLTPLLKSASITLTTAAALFFLRLQFNPAIAVPVAPPPATEESTTETAKEDVSFEEQERALEEHLAQNPTDTEALRALMEVRIRSRKLVEAAEVVDRLIELEPNEDEWPMLKAQIFSYSGDFESARRIYEEILEKDPFRVEGYHGLVMAGSESGDSLNDVMKRIESAMDKCKKEKKKSDLRDFKLLIAQIRVMEEKYFDALKVYDELVKEEPRDFRPYLCQGIIYTLLRKKEEAEKKFEQFRKLVPKNHPYREFFLDNMFATKFFSEKVLREEAGSSS
ncbi:Tetratricopeptide repeat (TPR)-like superfamily protein [Euphorbia peplus]|nr:Tetratricopeptide repeat (TPR)-like superfamily protein [Euphorbia peplus]